MRTGEPFVWALALHGKMHAATAKRTSFEESRFGIFAKARIGDLFCSPEGTSQISRWWSEAKPPVHDSIFFAPWRGAGQASVWRPFRARSLFHTSGGFASLKYRLISDGPSRAYDSRIRNNYASLWELSAPHKIQFSQQISDLKSEI